MADYTRELQGKFGWKIFDYPAYSPHLAVSNHQVFPHMRNWLVIKHGDNERLQEGVSEWLKNPGGKRFDNGIQKLIPRYD